MTLFRTTDSFEIPIIHQRLGGRKVDTKRLKEFWKEISEIADQRGCYVFSLRAGKGEKPWYVGKASVQTLSKECFSLHKIGIYNNVLGDRNGKPRLTFVIPEHKKGPWPSLAIDEVEEYLIGYAASRNAKLENKRRLPNQKWSIHGIVPGTQGQPTIQASAFKKLMGI